MGVDTRAVLAFGVYGDEVAPDVFDRNYTAMRAAYMAACAEEAGVSVDDEDFDPDDYDYEDDFDPDGLGAVHTVSAYRETDQGNAFVGVRLDPNTLWDSTSRDEFTGPFTEKFKAKWGVAPRLVLYVHWY